MAVDDRVHLVGAAVGLVDALRIDSDDAFRPAPHIHESGQVGAAIQTAGAGCGQGLGVAGDAVLPAREAARVDLDQHRIPQGRIAAGMDGQMQIRQIAGGRSAWINDHDTHRRARGFGSSEALVQDRVAPCQIAASQHHEIGQLQILIQAGHRVGPKGADMARDRGRHAKS